MTPSPQTETPDTESATPRDETPLREAYFSIRSVLRWMACGAFFFHVLPTDHSARRFCRPP